MLWQCFGGRSGQGKTHHCKIVLLDDTELIQEVQSTSRGQDLLDVVYRHLNLLETPYFGLRYLDSQGQTHWLDPHKKVVPQLRETSVFSLYFGVKFYASDPCKLLEEITRYQFFLQVKQDILQGRLPVHNDLAAQLFAYAVQSELGDYDPRRHQSEYISEFRFLPHQSSDLEAQVAIFHKELAGQVPSTAEMNFLERVKWLDMYGVDLHPVLVDRKTDMTLNSPDQRIYLLPNFMTGKDSIEYYLGLTPSGVLVLRNKSKVGNYFWPRITKVYFKGKYFMLRVRDKTNEEHTYGFELPTRQSCKHLWKCCVEHHSFFRLTQVREVPGGQPGKVFSLGSRFRYSGQTEKQAQADILSRAQPTVVRVPSRRYHRRIGQPDGADASPTREERREFTFPLETRVNVSVPQPVTLQRSSSTPLHPSAPWEEQAQQRGLYSSSANPSPRSIRSTASSAQRHHRRTSSVDSDSSCDSRRRRHHRTRKGSDNDSEASSRASRGSRSGHRRKKNSQGESDSDNHSHQSRSKHHHRQHRSQTELVDSGAQWKEVQKQQELQNAAQLRPQSAVVRDLTHRRSGYVNSGMETESEANYQQRKKNRRHRSKSPENGKKGLPAELKQHIEYRLVDPIGMSQDQLRDIKYTKVETAENRLFKIRYSPSTGKNRPNSTRQLGDHPAPDEGPPPPPYSAAPSANPGLIDSRPHRTTSLGCLQSDAKDSRLAAATLKHPWPMAEMDISPLIGDSHSLNKAYSQSKPDLYNSSPKGNDPNQSRSYQSSNSPRVTFQCHNNNNNNHVSKVPLNGTWVPSKPEILHHEMSTEL